MGGYKKHTPTVYVVTWPEESLIKVGYSRNQRWCTFALRGATVLHLFEFPNHEAAFAAESVGLTWLAERAPRAFTGKDEATAFLGASGGGWAECYRAYAADAQALLGHMLRHCPSIAPLMHATNATYATNARDQDPQRNPRLYNRARRAVDNSISAGEGTFFQSDIDLAVFLATRKPSRVRHEKYRRRAAEREARSYDLETANKLAFIRGQKHVLTDDELPTAFARAGYKVTIHGQQATQTETSSK